MKPLDAKELQKRFLTPARQKALAAIVGDRRSCVCGVAGSSAALLLSVMPHGKAPLLVIADSQDDAGYLFHDLCRLFGEDTVAMLPSGYKRDIKYGQADPPSQILRTETLRRISGEKSLQAVVTYPEALAERVADRDTLSNHTMRIVQGKDYDITELQKWLRGKGFAEVDYVYEPGQWASRGSILDIYGFADEMPVRIDFFGDEADSIRSFDVETQLSKQKLDSYDIVANVASGNNGTPLLGYIDADTLIAMRDSRYTLERIRAVCSEEFSQSASLTGEGDASAMQQLIDPDEFASLLDTFRLLEFKAGGRGGGKDASTPVDAKLDLDCSPQGVYHKNFDMVAESFTRFMADGYTLYILSDNRTQFDRLRSIFNDRGDNISFTPVETTLHEGFVDHQTKTCVFTDHQIFDRFHKYTLRSDRARSGKVALSLKELGQIEPGDYIVHIDHGVGKFAGLLRTEVGGRMQEMIKLVYQNNDIVFVSIHALHKLSKYRGKEGVPPKINRIGSGAWQRVKERTKSKLKDIARDLIRLYAARKEEKGFAFSPDSYLQHELEASFIYEDTPDQLTATQAVKADMESERPMDRLICGDVGFGKTEIAVRAAFKAATDGKQVAVLVPTTVLAYQHYRTFRERLKEFPVRVDYLSRARSPKQTKEILADLAEGKIDIIIGTHKLIGKSVKFKDLGLLVIDEEQKFGVAVKEKLKQLKINIDTLTMSATPIPRTLQFSLMGARDLSSINTPPANRYPIITSVDTLNDDIVAEALNFEISRGGQVFFINNRIEGLYDLEAMIHRLIPDAKVAVAHGQMPPEHLEKTIVDFAAHDYDVLLSTTIVESGVDMPNVNTIIVNNAQNFGLSELHQLRGRVGRSNRKAFCYLMVPAHVPLTPIARRRLQAIESFSDLGSGIHIAMQDLDIRGAGNLLGAEQSGFIADLGYETYQKILREAVMELRTEEFAGTFTADDGVTARGEEEFVADTVIETDLELLFPADYVPQESERIALYQRLDNIERETDLLEFRRQLEDRFGRIPRQASELLRVPTLRRLGRRLGVEKVTMHRGSLYLYFVDDSNAAFYQSAMFGRLLNYMQLNMSRARLRQKNDRRSMAVSDVPDVETAVVLLQEIIDLPTL